MAEKFKPHFEGEKYETVRKILPCNVHWKARDDLLKIECHSQEEYNGHYFDTPM